MFTLIHKCTHRTDICFESTHVGCLLGCACTGKAILCLIHLHFDDDEEDEHLCKGCRLSAAAMQTLKTCPVVTKSKGPESAMRLIAKLFILNAWSKVHPKNISDAAG